MPGAPMPGAPAQAGGVTPADMMSQAEQIAMQLLNMPYEQRRSQMLDLKKADETLHALVVQKMEEIRRQARQEGGFQALQQMVGGAGGGAPM